MTTRRPWPPARPAAPSTDAEPLPEPRFPRSRFLRPGYAVAEVDPFVARLRRAARDRPPGLTVCDVAEQRFRVRRVRRGYALRPVDDYLDRAVQVLREAGAAAGTSRARPVRTGWIYLVGIFLVALIVGYAAVQMLA